MQTGLHRNTISKVYRQLETDGVVEAMAGSGIYVRDLQKPREQSAGPHPQPWRHRSRSGGTQMCGRPAQFRLQPAADP